MGSAYADTKAYKHIYYLKSKWYLLALKKDIFFVPPNEDTTEEEVVDAFYWKILKKYCQTYFTPAEYYIGWLKALELTMANYTIPTTIDIVNIRKKSNQIVVAEHEVCFKTYFHKKKNLFPLLKKYTHTMKIGTVSFRVADMEIAIIESLYSMNTVQWNYIVEIVKQALKKNKKSLNRDKVMHILREWKHHTSANRLYQIAKSADPKLAETLLFMIKKYSFVIDV